MLRENLAFFVRGEDGAEYGPVSLEELREWVQENRAGIGTDVRLDEPGSIWQPWQSYPELVALLAEVQATGITPGLAGIVIAPLWRRILAFAIDLVFVCIPIMIICYTVLLICFPDWVTRDVVAFNQFLTDAQAGNQHPFNPPEIPLNAKVAANLISDIMMALYFTGFLAAHGKTPGKALLRLRVVDISGEKPGLMKAFLRAFVLIFSMSLLFIPLTYAFFNPQRRALHDLVADTCVVQA